MRDDASLIRLTTEYLTMTTPTIQLKRRNRRSDKRLRIIKKMASWRAAKERKRIERGGVEEYPRLVAVRHPFLSWAMRDDLSGEVVWMPFVSVRDTAKRAAVVANLYQPRK